MSDLRPHPRYRKVWLDEDWLQDFILSIMNWPVEVLHSKSEFSVDRRKRMIAFYIIHKYSGLGPDAIGRRYGQSYVADMIRQARDCRYVDKDKIQDALQPYLPIKQFEIYR